MSRPQTSPAIAKKPAFGRAKQTPLVDYTREKRTQRKIGPQSALEVYWPFYLGIGLPFTVMLAGVFWAIVSIEGLNIAGLPLFGILSFVLIFPTLVLAVPLTRILASVNGAVQTTNALFSWHRMSPGFQIGALIGLAVFIIHQWAWVSAPLDRPNASPSSSLAQLILLGLTYVGIAGTLLRRLESFLNRKLKDEDTPPDQTAHETSRREQLTPIQIKLGQKTRLALAVFAAGLVLTCRFILWHDSGLFPYNLAQEGGLAIGIGVIFYVQIKLYASIIRRLQRLFGLSVEFL